MLGLKMIFCSDCIFFIVFVFILKNFVQIRLIVEDNFLFQLITSYFGFASFQTKFLPLMEN